MQISMPPNSFTVWLMAQSSVLNSLFVSNIALDWEALATSITDLLGSSVDCARELWMRLDGLNSDSNIGSVLGGSQNDRESDTSGGTTDKDSLPLEAILAFKLLNLSTFSNGH